MSTTTTTSVWLTSPQAAARIGVHPMTMVNWRHLGRGPKYEKLGPGKGAHTRYHVDEIDKWMRSSKKVNAA